VEGRKFLARGGNSSEANRRQRFESEKGRGPIFLFWGRRRRGEPSAKKKNPKKRSLKREVKKKKPLGGNEIPKGEKPSRLNKGEVNYTIGIPGWWFFRLSKGVGHL